MRQHYVNCLENEAMVPFPRTRRVPFHCGCNKSTVAIYCVCRLPYDKDMFLYSYKCKAWYHPTCIYVPAWALNSRRKWRCSKCKAAKKMCYCLTVTINSKQIKLFCPLFNSLLRRKNDTVPKYEHVDASLNSNCALPSSPHGNLPALAVPGVGLSLILRDPGPGISRSRWHSPGF